MEIRAVGFLDADVGEKRAVGARMVAAALAGGVGRDDREATEDLEVV